LELDLQEVPRQDSGRSTHAPDHGRVQHRVKLASSYKWTCSGSSPVCLLAPWHLLGRMSKKNPNHSSVGQPYRGSSCGRVKQRSRREALGESDTGVQHHKKMKRHDLFTRSSWFVLSELEEHLIPYFFGGGLGPFIIRPFSFIGERLAAVVISKPGHENSPVW